MATPRKTTAKTTKTSIPAPVAAPTRSEVKGSGSKAPVTRTFTHQQIAERAYQIYASRGYTQGNPNDDWAEAERQLRAGL